MAQFDYSFTWQGTSTGAVLLKAAPAILHTIVIGSTGAAATPIHFQNATSSGTVGNTVAQLSLPIPGTYTYDIICQNGLWMGGTSSTQDLTVTWA